MMLSVFIPTNLRPFAVTVEIPEFEPETEIRVIPPLKDTLSRTVSAIKSLEAGLNGVICRTDFISSIP